MSGNTYVPPGSIDPIRKHPDEDLVYFADFSNLLDDTEDVSGTRPSLDSGATVTVASGLTAGSPTISTDKVLSRISGGTADTDYIIEWKVTDDASNIYVIEGVIEVRDN